VLLTPRVDGLLSKLDLLHSIKAGKNSQITMAAPSEKEKVTCGQSLKQSCGNFGNFLYSKRECQDGQMEGLVMGRNKSSWAKIGFFYLCFYLFLAAFFGAMLAVFLSTLTLPSDGGSPKLTQFIANKPGLTLVNKVESKYNATDKKTLDAHKKTVEDFLNKYTLYGDENDMCKENQTTGYEGKQACRYDFKTDMTPACSKDNYYGMENKQPCILIKMNKVFDWVPSGTEKRLNLVCKKGEEKVKVLNGGFLKAAMPFRGQSDYENPVAVLQAPKSSDTQKIRCYLDGPDIEVSDTYNPKRAFGKIEITVAPPLA